jgi:hypothetical protein
LDRQKVTREKRIGARGNQAFFCHDDDEFPIAFSRSGSYFRRRCVTGEDRFSVLTGLIVALSPAVAVTATTTVVATQVATP